MDIRAKINTRIAIFLCIDEIICACQWLDEYAAVMFTVYTFTSIRRKTKARLKTFLNV